jgi:hypothetical protein
MLRTPVVVGAVGSGGGAEIAIAWGIPVYRISSPIASREERFMAETVITLRLNQQQLELLDRTIAQGVAPDRVSLVRLALREYAAAHKSDTAREASR